MGPGPWFRDDTLRAMSLRSMCPDVLVTWLGVSPFSTVPALIYREWKEDFSISATEPLKSGRQGASNIEAPCWAGGLVGERASVAWST